ncbi:MAG: MGH1-like glycoside hydrolase domain-containing protein [Candidatus Geothermincolia bacterium]
MPRISREDKTRLHTMARRVLESTDRVFGDKRVFMPDAKKYPFQCYWDSAFQALVAARYWPERAEQEFYSLESVQFEDGRIPHLVLWDKPPLVWRVICERGGWVGSDGRAVLSTQPPVAAFCAWDVYKRTGHKEFLERVFPFLAAEMHYASETRDLLGDGLTSIVNCMESGTDESPVYDEVMGIKGDKPLALVRYGLKLSRDVREYAKAGNNVSRLRELGRFVVEDLCNNSVLCRSLRAMGDIARELGDAAAARDFERRAVELAAQIEELCWDESSAIFLTRYMSGGEIRLNRTSTLASQLPLFTGLISKDRAKRVIRENILSEERFWSPYPLSFVSMEDSRERPGWSALSLPILWRGGTWINMNWMIAIGLEEYGYGDAASELAVSTARMMLDEGAMREFFNSRTGAGYGGKSYGWSTLVIDMLERHCPQI